jgi:ATP-dependent Clp protease ATP-binding subunit ClpA
MRRAIQKYIEDPLSEEILKGGFKEVNKARATLINNEIKFIGSDLEALVTTTN